MKTNVKSDVAVKKYEYATTHGSFASYYDGTLEHEADAPVEPKGNGWEMCGMACSRVFIYWSWRRKVEPLHEQ